MAEYIHSINSLSHPQQDIFTFYDNGKNSKIGELVCHKSELPLRPDYDGANLAIDYLEATSRDRGLGTDMLRFAHRYSEQIGCGGYLVLKADGTATPERIPHLFYRKMGFSTNNKKIDRQLDKFIARNQSATTKDFGTMLMFYPPVREEKANLLNRLTKGMIKLFKK